MKLAQKLTPVTSTCTQDNGVIGIILDLCQWDKEAQVTACGLGCSQLRVTDFQDTRSTDESPAMIPFLKSKMVSTVSTHLNLSKFTVKMLSFNKRYNNPLYIKRNNSDVQVAP